MKTYRNLFSKIASFENLYFAYRKARKGKRAKIPAAEFERRQEDELLALESELHEQRYQPDNYDNFLIHEPKKRLISAQDSLTVAGKLKGEKKLEALHNADIQLEKLRVWIRLSHDLDVLKINQYEHLVVAQNAIGFFLNPLRKTKENQCYFEQLQHLSRMVSEVGRLLGAWIKKISAS